MLYCDTTKDGCGVVRGTHTLAPPHGIAGTCPAYKAAVPCGDCGVDVILHEPTAPHPHVVGEVVLCPAVKPPAGFDSAESPYEGGGGQSGGGGSSGGW